MKQASDRPLLYGIPATWRELSVFALVPIVTVVGLWISQPRYAVARNTPDPVCLASGECDDCVWETHRYYRPAVDTVTLTGTYTTSPGAGGSIHHVFSGPGTVIVWSPLGLPVASFSLGACDYVVEGSTFISVIRCLPEGS